MKKLTALLCTVCLALAVFTGCSGGDSPSVSSDGSAATAVGENSGDSGDTVTLKLFHRYPDVGQIEFFDKILDQFMEENPDIIVEQSTSGRDNYRDKLKVVLGSNDVPDVFFSYSGESTHQFVREDLLNPLDEYLDSDAEWKGWLHEAVYPQYTFDGQLYGVPFRVSVSCIYYNKDIFAANGLSAPSTFDELIESCAVLDAAGITAMSFGNSEIWVAPQWIGPMNHKLVPADVRRSDYDLEGDWSDAGYIQALDIFGQLLNYCNSDINGKTNAIARQEFMEGKTAMYWSESVVWKTLEDMNDSGIDLGAFTIPDIPTGRGDHEAVQGAPEGFVMSASTRYPQQSARLIKFLSSPDVGRQLTQDLGWFNGCVDIVDPTEESLLADVYRIFNDSPDILSFLDNDIHARVVDVYLAQMQSFINGSVTAEQVMEQVANEAREVVMDNG